MIELSIIILSYNTKDLTLSCVKSIASQYNKELIEKKIEIIVVDNNSSDDSVSMLLELKKKLSSLNVVQNKKNVGFAKGCNIGASSAKGEYVLFLNSDTQVLDKGFISMVDFMKKNPKVGILGGKLHSADGSIQPSAGKFYNLFNLFIMLLGLERLGLLRSSPTKIEKVDWVSGACMMVKSDVFKKIAGFDEKLFMYMEDMEICFRARKLGLLTFFYPNVQIMHKSLGSSNRTFAIINIYKGILRFYSKHKSYFEYSLAKALLFIKAGLLIFVGILTLNPALRDRYRKALEF